MNFSRVSLLSLVVATSPLLVQAGTKPVDEPTPVAAAVSPMPSFDAPAMPASVLVPALTPVVMELLQPISTRTAKPGDRFDLRVSQPVVVAGQVVIPAGSPALGEVIHAQKGGAFGKAGELLVTVRHIEVAGQKIPMRLFRPAQGRDRTGAVLATTIAVGVFSAFIRGEQIELPVGMAVSAAVAKDTTLAAPAATPLPSTSTTENQGQNP